MKRINPQTNKPFRCGDVREDGQVFRSYDMSRIRKDGTFCELWLRSDVFDAIKARMKQRARDRRQVAKWGRK